MSAKIFCSVLLQFLCIYSVQYMESDLYYAVTLIYASENEGALCLDGSIPRYYYYAGEENINKFIIFFEYGGWCSTVFTHINPLDSDWDTCYERSKTWKGSTRTSYDAAYKSPPIDLQYLHNNKSVNPIMYNWNKVYVRYCDGSSYSSNRDQPTLYNDTLLYFRGWRILNGVFQHLLNYTSFNNATDIVISGCSAGALNVFLNIDYIVNTFINNSKNVNILGLADSGYFNEYYDKKGNYTEAMKWVFEYNNMSYNINQKCITYYNNNYNNKSWKCIFAENVIPFVQSPLFLIQSRFDQWQIENELMSPNNTIQVNLYGNNITKSFENVIFNNMTKTYHTGCLTSCYHHCGQWMTFPVENNITIMQSFSNFYNQIVSKQYQQIKSYKQIKPYVCTECCNCTKWSIC